MTPIWTIAINTFQEARHNKVLHIAAGFAAILILFSFFMGEVSLYQNDSVSSAELKQRLRGLNVDPDKMNPMDR